MIDQSSWDWQEGNRTVSDVGTLVNNFEEVHEFAVSPNGERIAVPVKKGEDEFSIWDTGNVIEGDFERTWNFVFTPDNRLVSFVRIDDEWTVAVDGTPWEETFDFVWNLQVSPDGKAIAVQVKQEPKYTIAINGVPWSEGFLSVRDYTLSPDGKRAAALVQVDPLAEADIFKFMEGTWGVAVDGQPWDAKYINVYKPCFSPDGKRVVVEIRTDIAEYTFSENGIPWETKFGCIWEPCYRKENSIIAPVKVQGGWSLAENGKVIWPGRYVQLWHQRVSPDGERVAAVAATGYGKWTVVVDDKPWKKTFSDMVLAPIFSPNGDRIAAIVKDDNRWGIAQDGTPWPSMFDMVWDPVFSPDGDTTAAKVEQDGKYSVCVNGKVWDRRFDALWEPTFSPDGKSILVRAVENGKYNRLVVPVAKML